MKKLSKKPCLGTKSDQRRGVQDVLEDKKVIKEDMFEDEKAIKEL